MFVYDSSSVSNNMGIIKPPNDFTNDLFVYVYVTPGNLTIQISQVMLFSWIHLTGMMCRPICTVYIVSILHTCERVKENTSLSHYSPKNHTITIHFIRLTWLFICLTWHIDNIYSLTVLIYNSIICIRLCFISMWDFYIDSSIHKLWLSHQTIHPTLYLSSYY